MIRKLINEKKKLSLSNREILDFLGGMTNIVIYDKMHKFNTIFDLFKNFDTCVILYLSKPKYGHWTLLINHGDYIEFFDSYGGEKNEPDTQLDYIDPEIKKKSNEDFPYLTKLLYESELPIEYNNHKFQMKGNGIATCGRHVISRILFKDLHIDEYYDFMNHLKNELKMNYDDIVTLLTLNIK